MAQRTTHQLATTTLVPFAQAPHQHVELWALPPAQLNVVQAAVQPVAIDYHDEQATHSESQDTQQQVVALKKTLEEAAKDCERLQSSLTSQQQLEHLLVQGRTHLQDLRRRLQHVTADRDRLQIEVSERKRAHQQDVERLQIQLGEMTNHAFLQRMLAEQRERDMTTKELELRQHIDALDEQVQNALAERDEVAARLADREAAHKKYADDRMDERYTFERLLAEASSNQREMVQELDEKRQQLDTLREAAIRAQSLAREIMRAHEVLPE
jgi:chromosome segregation ATPase